MNHGCVYVSMDLHHNNLCVACRKSYSTPRWCRCMSRRH